MRGPCILKLLGFKNCLNNCIVCLRNKFSYMRWARIPRLLGFKNDWINCFAYCCTSTFIPNMPGPCIPRLLGIENYLNNRICMFTWLSYIVDRVSRSLNARATRTVRAPNKRRPLVRRREAIVRVRRSDRQWPWE